MPSCGGICSFIRTRSLSLYCSKYFVNGFHSLQQCERKKRFLRAFPRRATKSVKENIETKDKELKVYMRNIIQNISRILRLSTWDSAQQQLENLAIKWDSFTVNQALKTHPPMEKAWLFFNWASRQKKFKHDQYTYTTMLDIFGEAGRISSMHHVFEQMKDKGIKIDVVTYTSMLHWLSKHGDFNGSLRIWEEMKVGGFHPTVVSYTAFMKVLLDNDRPKEAGEIYKNMIEVGRSPNCHTYTVLIEYLAVAGKFKEALDIMSKMQEAGVQPDKATCNIMVQKCARAGEIVAMVQVLQYMRETSLVLRYPVFLEALQSIKNAGESEHLLREVNPHLMYEGIDEQISETEALDRTLVLTLLERHNFVAIRCFFDGLLCKKYSHMDSALISTVIHACCANNNVVAALTAFDYGINMHIELERTAYTTLIGHFIRTASFAKVEEVIQHMVKSRVTIGTHLFCQLIHKLGSAGMLDSAVNIFNSVSNEQNVATYTALLDAYMRHGDVDKGIQLYMSMTEKGIRASSGTLEVLIGGLRKAGRLTEMEVYRKEQRDLQRSEHSRDIYLNECLCNLLYDRFQALLTRG
ncbi:pentatricopeptide repeat-containing protein At2g01390-like [Aristolochia californica]|uniref:pentatricopeptide repeat-containing protein At2g01390-like n=1 Tax=Aristolochia californica TaxID=171875 RepID=UPI0035D5CCA5